MSAVLLYMYGGDVDLLEEWFDENSRFCPKEPSMPPHMMAKDEDAMEVDENVRNLPFSPESVYTKYGNDPHGVSQAF